ncbi:MAG: hypothetical protein ACUVS5_11880 [Anaerolineae bacterium]
MGSVVRTDVWRTDAYPGWHVLVVRVGTGVVALKPEQDGRGLEGEWDYFVLEPGQDVGQAAQAVLARFLGRTPKRRGGAWACREEVRR